LSPTLPGASIAQPGKRGIPTANIAITSNGLNGGREARGTARWTMLVCVTLATYRENAVWIRGAEQPTDRSRRGTDECHIRFRRLSVQPLQPGERITGCCQTYCRQSPASTTSTAVECAKLESRHPARVGAHPKAPSPSPWWRGFFRARALCHQHDLAAEPSRTCKFALAIASLMKSRTIRAMASSKL